MGKAAEMKSGFCPSGEDHVADLQCGRVSFSDLQVVFGLGRLMACSHAAIHPLG
jgi:hypothetical protein